MKGSQFTLDGFGQNPDGSWSKKKTVLQPREQQIINDKKVITANANYTISDYSTLAYTGSTCKRKITLTLFGEPMPKQSVRSFIAKDKIMHYQPKEMTARVTDYQKQIKEQLPKDFIRFETRVHITKMHFIFAPLKAFHKIKGRMEAIHAGEIIYKETRPDLPDNLKKLVNDSMSEIVFKDDSIIVSEDNVKKYYGTGGAIIIEMEGY